MNTTTFFFFCNFLEFIFGVFISKVCAVTRKSKSTWTWMENAIDIFFLRPELTVISFSHLIWNCPRPEAKIGVFVCWMREYKQGEKQLLLSCVLIQQSWSLIWTFFPFGLPSSLIAQVTWIPTSVLCCFADPDRDLLRVEWDGLLRLPLDQTTSGKMGWPVFGFGRGLCIWLLTGHCKWLGGINCLSFSFPKFGST